jgi:hypothetical protein
MTSAQRRLGSLLAALIALDIAVAFGSPYVDHDPMIYVMIGEAIWQRGIWPYAAGFDHKPILTYLAYGPIGYLPRNVWEFHFVALGMVAVTGVLVRYRFVAGRVSLATALLGAFAATLGSVGLSGNTEMLFVPLMLLAIQLLAYADARAGRLALASALLMVAANVNYVVFFVAPFVVLYALATGSRDVRQFARSAAVMTLAALATALALYAALRAAGMDVDAYLATQHRFLTGYAGEARPASLGWCLRLGLCLVLAAFGFRRFGGLTAPDAFDRCLAVLIVVAAVSFALSRKYYGHYLYIPALPAVLLVLRRLDGSAAPRLAAVAGKLVAVALLVDSLLVAAASDWWRRDVFDVPYRRLHAVVGDVPVMAMDSSIVPQYYAQVRPFQPIIWPQQAQVMLGRGADIYFARMLARHPAFVMTQPGACPAAGPPGAACALLRRDYRLALQEPGQGTQFDVRALQVGYDLYRLAPTPSAVAPGGA